jgi:alkylhydroperoxidase family enzyme
MHSALLSREQPELVAALRAGGPLPDRRLQALADFVRALIHGRGRVPEARWQALRAAGFDEQHALDALLGTGVYLLSTLTNVLTGAPLDAAFERFAWTPATDTPLSAASPDAHAP